MEKRKMSRDEFRRLLVKFDDEISSLIRLDQIKSIHCLYGLLLSASYALSLAVLHVSEFEDE